MSSYAAINLLRVVPRPMRDGPMRDALYDVVARNRYRWFGKTECCKLIPPDLLDSML